MARFPYTGNDMPGQDLSQKDLDVIAKNAEKCTKERWRKIRKEIKLCKDTGTKCSFDLRTLLESGCSVDTIRKVYRNENG